MFFYNLPNLIKYRWNPIFLENLSNQTVGSALKFRMIIPPIKKTYVQSPINSSIFWQSQNFSFSALIFLVVE